MICLSSFRKQCFRVRGLILELYRLLGRPRSPTSHTFSPNVKESPREIYWKGVEIIAIILLDDRLECKFLRRR